MQLSICPMSLTHAKAISHWAYPEPYSIYGMDGSEGCIEEMLSGSYFAAVGKEGELVGYFCYGASAQVPAGKKFGIYDSESIIDIGLGVRPDLCGHGLGLCFLTKGMEHAAEKYGLNKFRLTVAAFNLRAIKVYEKAGFRKAGAFTRAAEKGSMEFTVMICEL